ncbi:MAG TPA: indolepyruvate oxidoreductase subunit beta [Anaerolineales bacterium]|nr:indolepyruvate oxidoreductase subunit beta [Anaerolineales bacterium]
MRTFNFLLAGVGGQGTLLASDIVADVGMRLGGDVKKSEVHGMSQRGGAVTSHVRWGERLASPLCEMGTVDYFLAQEKLEALRWIEFLAPTGTVLLSDQTIPPTSTVFGTDAYPDDDSVQGTLRQAAANVLRIPAQAIAVDLGNSRVANSVLLGALSAQLEFPAEAWLAVVAERVPHRHIEINRRAFMAGREGHWRL